MKTKLKYLLERINCARFDGSEKGFIVPISLPEIRNNLQKNGKETIQSCLEDCGVVYLSNYKKCLKDLMLSESFYYRPGSDYIPINYYVGAGVNNDAKSIVYVELENWLKNLMNPNYYPNVKYITGGRGIGKTITLNVLLNNNIDALFNSKVIFTRCDIIKFVDLKNIERKIDGKNSFEISDYINCQFLFILCEQLDIPFYNEIFNLLKDKTYDYREHKDFTTDSPQLKTQKIGEKLLKYRNLILRYKEDNWDEPDKNYARQVIIKSQLLLPYQGSARAYENWIYLSKVIRKILIVNGYKFLTIIDGIDNINRHNNDGSNSIDFRMICNEIAKYEKKCIETKSSTVWFLMRNNTYEIHKNRDENRGSHSISTTTTPIKFTTDRYVNKYDIIEKRKKCFNIYDKYLKGIFEDSESIPNIPIDENLINMSHHIRNYIFNWINFLFWHKVYDKYSDTVENRMNFSKHFKYSNLLLNDRLLLDTKNKNLTIRQYDDVLFNIFYYDLYDAINRPDIWHGWCTIRIIQYIKYYYKNNNKEAKEEDILYKLSEIFEYEDEILKKKFHHLVVYGFIRYADNSDLCVKITHEGEYLLDFIFSKVELLYYCALDTPLPKSCVTMKFITAHNNDSNAKNFAENCLNTTATFLKFLNVQHELEMNKIKDEQMKAFFYNPIEKLDEKNDIAGDLYNALTSLRLSNKNRS